MYFWIDSWEPTTSGLSLRCPARTQPFGLLLKLFFCNRKDKKAPAPHGVVDVSFDHDCRTHPSPTPARAHEANVAIRETVTSRGPVGSQLTENYLIVAYAEFIPSPVCVCVCVRAERFCAYFFRWAWKTSRTLSKPSRTTSSP